MPSLSRHFIPMGERPLLLRVLINVGSSVATRLCPLSRFQFLYSALLNPIVTVYIRNFIISWVLGNEAALPSKVLQSRQRSSHLSKHGILLVMWEIKIYHLEDWIFGPYDMCPFCMTRNQTSSREKKCEKSIVSLFLILNLTKILTHIIPSHPLHCRQGGLILREKDKPVWDGAKKSNKREEIATPFSVPLVTQSKLWSSCAVNEYWWEEGKKRQGYENLKWKSCVFFFFLKQETYVNNEKNTPLCLIPWLWMSRLLLL